MTNLRGENDRHGSLSTNSVHDARRRSSGTAPHSDITNGHAQLAFTLYLSVSVVGAQGAV